MLMKHYGIIGFSKIIAHFIPFDAGRCRIVRCNSMRCAIGRVMLLGLPRLLLHLLLLVGGGQKLFRGVLVAVRLPHVHRQDRLR